MTLLGKPRDIGLEGIRSIEIELEPTLKACIQTKAKQAYDQIARQLLDETNDEPLTGRFEMLKDFLETTDFGGLRDWYEPYLTAGKSVRFRLGREADGELEYEFEIR